MFRDHLILILVLLGARASWAEIRGNAATYETALEEGLAHNRIVLVAFFAVGSKDPVALLRSPSLSWPLTPTHDDYQSSEPQSQALYNEYLEASIDAAGSGSLLSVDCEAKEETTICTKYEISSFPSFVLFENGVRKAEYLGSKRRHAIVNYVARMARPAMTELRPEGLAAFKTIEDDVVCIGYISAEDEAARQALSAVAEKYRQEFTFGLISDVAAIKAENMERSTVVCHVPEDGRTRSFSSFGEPNGLDAFVSETSRRAIGELTRANQQRLLDRGWPMVYLFGATENDRAELRRTLHDFAKSYYDSLTCVTVDHLEFPDLQAKLGLEPGVFPAGAVHQLSKDNIYPYPRGMTIDSRSIQKFGLDVWQGRIKAWTPPGATTSEKAGPTKAVTRKISMANIPGVNIRVAGRDEL